MTAGAPTLRLREALLAPIPGKSDGPFVLVSAPGGYGKSTLLTAARNRIQEEGQIAALVSLTELHDDPGLFVEDLIEAVRIAIGDRDEPERQALEDRFGAELLRRLSAMVSDAGETDGIAANGERLARRLLRSIRDLGEPVTLLVDDVHRISRKGITDGILGALLAGGEDASLRLILATRGGAPHRMARLVAEGRAVEVGASELALRSDEVQALLLDRLENAETNLAELVPLLVARTGGWAMGVLVLIRALARRPEADPRPVLAALGRDDALFGPLAEDLLADERAEMLDALEWAALLGSIERETLASALERSHLSDSLLYELVEKRYAVADGDLVEVHALWRDLILARLRDQREDPQRMDRIRRCAKILEDEGHEERAASLCLEFQMRPEMIGLFERHGLEWVERGQHQGVARWLAFVADDVPGNGVLELLSGLLDARSHPARALSSIERAAARFHREGRHELELAALHNIVIVAGNQGRIDVTRAAVIRLLSLRRLLTSSEARGVATLFAGLAAFQRGRYGTCRRLGQHAATYALGPRERGALAMGRVQLAVLSGAYQQATELVEATLADPAQRSHGPSFYTLRALRAFCRGVLDRDRPTAFVQLREAREAVGDLGMRLSEGECSWMLARLLLVEGRAEEAALEAEAAAGIYAGVREADGETASRALQAHATWLAGDHAGAEATARVALAAFEVAREKGPLRFRSYVTPLAARVLAEVGAGPDAERFARRFSKLFEPKEVFSGHHTAELSFARIAALAGNEDAAKRHLNRAARSAKNLDAPAPEVDPALLAWANEKSALASPAASSEIDRPQRPQPLRIETLGGLEVWLEGKRVGADRWRGQTTRRLLLRLLCAEGRPIERERLATELWPDAEPAGARGNLRVGLSRLRRVFEPEREAGEPESWLEIGGQGVALAERALASWDVRVANDLMAAVREARQAADGDQVLSLAERTLEMYAGPFAPDAYDDWVVEWRARIERDLLECGLEAAEETLEDRPSSACALAEKLVEHVPSEERAWLLLIRSWIAQENRTAALKSAQRAQEALRRTLDLESTSALDALIQKIREGA